jgi:hypothetical protein
MILKPCPCGKTPTQLHITEGSTFRWRYVSGDCCGWMIEARVNTMRPKSEEKDYEECAKAWNEQDRA